jgi:hypothetical protein
MQLDNSNSKIISMKKYILILVLFAGCKKESKQDLTTTTIKVVESVTNLPVSGATVVLSKCDYGCPLGLGATIFFNGLTDANGTCQVLSENYNDPSSIINVAKTKYWPFNVIKSTTLSLIPEGWMQLRIIKTANYPVGSKLILSLWNEAEDYIDTKYYNTAADSIILVKGFGSQLNKINWQVSNSSVLNDGTFNQQIPRFDTVKSPTLNY